MNTFLDLGWLQAQNVQFHKELVWCRHESDLSAAAQTRSIDSGQYRLTCQLCFSSGASVLKRNVQHPESKKDKKVQPAVPNLIVLIPERNDRLWHYLDSYKCLTALETSCYNGEIKLCGNDKIWDIKKSHAEIERADRRHGGERGEQRRREGGGGGGVEEGWCGSETQLEVHSAVCLLIETSQLRPPTEGLLSARCSSPFWAKEKRRDVEGERRTEIRAQNDKREEGKKSP